MISKWFYHYYCKALIINIIKEAFIFCQKGFVAFSKIVKAMKILFSETFPAYSIFLHGFLTVYYYIFCMAASEFIFGMNH